MLIPVQYHKRNYPTHIKPHIDEVAAHFDISSLSIPRSFSLHTEYSYGKRKLDSSLMDQFPIIQSANKKSIPQLWHSEHWALEFAGFIKALCQDQKPTIIEIHPPFTDYTSSIDDFLSIYGVFEDEILKTYPDVKILIENRSGSQYRGGKFLVSSGNQLNDLCEAIQSNNVNLRLALDFLQIFTFNGGPQALTIQEIHNILSELEDMSSMTESIHLWGKMRSKSGRIVSHSGDLDTYFENQEKKEVFLNWLYSFLDDGKTRYFVPEVNSSDEHLYAIINDLERVRINFTEKDA